MNTFQTNKYSFYLFVGLLVCLFIFLLCFLSVLFIGIFDFKRYDSLRNTKLHNLHLTRKLH